MYRTNWMWRLTSVGPTLLFLLIFTVGPILLLITMSFHEIRWEGGSANWIFKGLLNYMDLPKNTFFKAAIGNTFIFVFSSVAAEMVLGFILALLVSQLTTSRVMFLTTFLLPILVPGIVIGAIWKLMYNIDFGLLNDIVGLVGIPPQDWLGNKHLALGSVVLVDIWHWTSFCFLLLLAGLESIPNDVYEAARLDGAGFFSELRHITIPLMMPVIVVTLFTRTLLAFKVFDEVFLLTQGGPGTATEVLSYTVFRIFFDEDREGFGSAMCISIIIMIIIMLLVGLKGIQKRKAA